MTDDDDQNNAANWRWVLIPISGLLVVAILYLALSAYRGSLG
jgi:hypothetical protein